MFPSRVWLVVPDPFSARLFFDTGIIGELRKRLDGRLTIVLDAGEQSAHWKDRTDGTAVMDLPALIAGGGILSRVDRRLDEAVGFYPLSVRQSLRHGFNRSRMQSGHSNWFLDTDRAGSLPQSATLDSFLKKWHYGRLRYVPAPLVERLRRDQPTVALANTQMKSIVPFVVGARRAGLPVVGHIASWDHTVGKGIVPPGLARYIVQNHVMRDDLVQYHAVDARRIVISGWPQTDVFHRRRPRTEFEGLVHSLGLDASRPVVLVMGNSPVNAPFEKNFVERLVAWWAESGAAARFSLLFRPHPRDREWRERYAAPLLRDGMAVQEPSFTDLEALAVLLQHGNVVVSNAGTILLDALVNDRPAVCVLYDEGAPPGESWAWKNVSGEHYKALIESAAFYRAENFDDVTAAIERALAHPRELAEERRRVAREVVGEIDGRAAERVADAIVGAVG